MNETTLCPKMALIGQKLPEIRPCCWEKPKNPHFQRFLAFFMKYFFMLSCDTLARKLSFFTLNPKKLVPDTWAQILGPIWAKNRKIDHLLAGFGESKKATDTRLGLLVALTMVHNIPQNQPDRMKAVVYRIPGIHHTLPKKQLIWP